MESAGGQPAAAAPLSEDQIAHFYREGYLVVRGLVPAAAVAGVLGEARGRVRAGEHWQATIFDHEDPELDAPLHRLLVEPRVVGAAEQLLGTPPRVFYGMLAVVRAGGGTGLPWHQDNQYTLLLGGALNIFIALSEVTPENGGLWIAPRSHLYGVLPARRNETYAPGHREAATEPENGIPLPALAPGDACLLDRCTLHRSGRNETDQHRYAYAAQFMSSHARDAATGRRDPRRMLAVELAARYRALPATENR